MKKIILFLILFLIISPNVFAQDTNATPSATPVDNSIEQKLLNTVVSAVPELKLVQKRGFIGTVTDANSTQITVTDTDGNIRFIDVDEFTKFSSPDSTSDSFGISDIKKGDQIGVLGLYHTDSRRTLARFVNVMDLPTFISGVVAVKDDADFDLTVTTPDGKNIKVAIESVSKTYDVDSTGKLIKSGFSKISTGENILVSGFYDPKDKTTLTAGRVILFPGIPANPAINITIQQALPSSTVIPSTGSGKKLTPIVQ